MTSDMVEASCLWVIFTFILETTEIVPQVIKGFATYGRVTSNPRGHFLDGFIPGPDEREVNINVSHTWALFFLSWRVRSGSLDLRFKIIDNSDNTYRERKSGGTRSPLLHRRRCGRSLSRRLCHPTSLAGWSASIHGSPPRQRERNGFRWGNSRAGTQSRANKRGTWVRLAQRRRSDKGELSKLNIYLFFPPFTWN